ncbi:MAG TPA: dipeptidase [Thermomicrobiales bacterium]|nr:dipeptidase [Thermomicrobiales bacterium]
MTPDETARRGEGTPVVATPSSMPALLLVKAYDICGLPDMGAAPKGLLMTTVLDSNLIPVFDGHNDTILSLLGTGRSFYDRSDLGHLDRVRATEGGLVGGFFAVFVPDIDPATDEGKQVIARIGRGLEGVPLSTGTGPSLAYAQQFTMAAVGQLLRIEGGEGAEIVFDETLGFDMPRQPLGFVHSAAELTENIESGDFAAILHFEGAEMIDDQFYALETWHAVGLRSLGPVWSRSNVFGHGVPFAFPSSGDTGPGLTDLGKALVEACNGLGIMLDVSHLNEKGFWDLAAVTEAPIVATHSNVHAICQSSRNLTDKQFDAIKDSDGLVGLNFHCGFLRPDGARDANTPLEVMADHLDYMVDRLGIDRVALGSDFDGALMPNDLSDCSKLPNLIAVLRQRGYDDAALRKIGYQNWIRVLEATWGI